MNDITKTIRAMWEENASLQDIRAYLLQFHPYEIAAAIAELPEELRDELYGVFTSKEIAEIVAYVEPEQAADFLEDVANRQVAGVIKEMSADDATDILEHFEDDKRQAVINLLDRETRDDIETWRPTRKTRPKHHVDGVHRHRER